MHENLSVVGFGGGAGQSTLLGALARLPFVTPTAVVTTFDSGGSSRALKDTMGVLPYGDIQRCVFALSPYPHVRDIFNARLDMAELSPPYHTAGNLLLSALEQEFRRHMDIAAARSLAVRAMERMFAVRGRVIPASLESANLHASFNGGLHAHSEVQVDAGLMAGQDLEKVWLEPQVPANHDALDAIASAAVLILGPGSMYTSVVPPLLPVGMRDAIAASTAPILWVMNLVSEGDRMALWKGEDYLRMMASYAGRAVSCVLVNSQDHGTGGSYERERKRPIRASSFRSGDCRVIKAPLWLDRTLARHDEGQLAKYLGQLLPRLS